VLNLKNVFDVPTLREYAGRYDINDTIQQLRRKISLSPGVVILKDSARSKLNDLAQSGLSDIKFYQYAELLAENITNINLEHLAKQLLEVSAKLPEGQEDIKLSLEKNAYDLEHYHRDLVVPMAQRSEILSVNALMLQENIKFNHSSMADAIHDLVDEVTKAQQFLNKDGPEYVQYVRTALFFAFLQYCDPKCD
jgi:prominin 1